MFRNTLLFAFAVSWLFLPAFVQGGEEEDARAQLEEIEARYSADYRNYTDARDLAQAALASDDLAAAEENLELMQGLLTRVAQSMGELTRFADGLPVYLRHIGDDARAQVETINTEVIDSVGEMEDMRRRAEELRVRLDAERPLPDSPDGGGSGSAGTDIETPGGGGSTCEQINSGIVPCGNGGPECKCTMCHFVVLGSKITTFIMQILVVTSILIITIAGVIYVVSAGNSGMTTTAKNAIKYVLWGVFVILFAWVAVTFVLSRLAGPDSPLGLYQSGDSLWDFQCNQSVPNVE